MTRFWLALSLVVVVAPVARANPMETLIGGSDPTLSREQHALLDALKRNRPEDTETQTRPVIHLDNTVQYVYGTADPTAICTPFDGCDVRLQAGEVVHDASMGDQRWQVAVLFEGDPPNEVPHVAIYPHDVGFKATLVVTTNRRTYHIRLISRAPSDDTPTTTKISFIYPEDLRTRFAEARARQEQARAPARPTAAPARPSAPAGPRTGSIAFAYELRGRAPWKPVRVFNNGERTMIDFPNAVRHTELPTLLIMRSEGDIFNDEELVMVNTHYDPKARRMTVDSVFDQAVLVAGVGGNQIRVTIRRLPPER